MHIFIKLIIYLSLTVTTHCHKAAKLHPTAKNFYDEEQQLRQKRSQRLQSSNLTSTITDIDRTALDHEFKKNQYFEKKYKDKLWHTSY